MKKVNKDNELGIKENLIKEFNISKEVAEKLIADYGADIANIITDKPYILSHYLMPLEEVKQIIEKCSTNKNEDYKNRNIVAALIIYVIESMAEFEGHVFCYKSELEDRVKGLEVFSNEEKSLNEALELLRIENEIVIDNDSNGEVCIYLSRLYKAEVELANVMSYLVKMNQCTNWKINNQNKIGELINSYNNSDIKLNKDQIDAINTALNNGISIVSGLAGTGKTTVIKTIVEGFKAILPIHQPEIHIVAYTGKSVDELSKKTGIQGTTIHRFLGIGVDVNYKIESKKVDVIVVDESGLIGIELMNQLICSAVKENPNVRVVIVGDPFQLQSIEPGCILKELLKSEVIPVVELRDVVRQKKESLITNNAHKIIKGTGLDESKSGVRLKRSEFEFIETESSDIKEKVLGAIDKLLNEGTSIYNIQVMSPMKKGINGVEELNREIADRFNYVTERDIYKFEVVDPIIVIRSMSSKGIFNGQQGWVKKVEKSTNGVELITADLFGIEVSFNKNEIEEIELSYASTIHKMQGSECEVAIIVVDKAHERMLSRELLYVGVTRGVKQVILVGDKEAFNEGVRSVSKERNSLLAERLVRISS
ncbi:ATP-dependent DNA helicase [Clostridium saccharobutylicum]|uniref:Exodeoxyribonuclease V n=1 Tax=Clostridium saccharobutylicum DSM 13864 TaxID=1345695 RepID=U5MT40_CLOSA|nr:AAA family ATPase [Clostridium saccharobutylicum]AGX43914.1 exodeoxyribonuclease V [Clostridium saccharobutylicum DSM 13864]AQR91211.1 ATP-dependent RecD-like DNA helicase [Clostridium saccharobutylicum]AQS01115.1 ATP-dependent RecD-like DNA helicase [Clostridium saccharobutylicum]AQS15098.1 ATP-dependent RecD-like DNA helicase [Clostridium saccharobutylicum]MBA2905224.1 exodeoxyribonuclease V alpha subunit [Clostridium saccharobutylicum]